MSESNRPPVAPPAAASDAPATPARPILRRPAVPAPAPTAFDRPRKAVRPFAPPRPGSAAPARPGPAPNRPASSRPAPNRSAAGDRPAPVRAQPAPRPAPPQRPAPPAVRPAPGGAVAVRAEAGEGTRLNKRMAELGLCSRREGDAWIEQGWVTVNGEVAVMGQLVQPLDRIAVAPEARDQQEQQVTILLHKPMGFVSGQAEDGHQPAVTLINPRTHWQADTSRTRFNFHQLRGLAPAGRLDIDSVGLLVLTQDGRVARQIIGEDSEMEKEYLVRVAYTGAVNGAAEGSAAATYGRLQEIDERDAVRSDVQSVFPADRLALLRHGLSLDGQPLKPAQVEWQNPEQLRFVLTEGKKR
ncbi:MAG: pseudouridine synthase, partial [Burkholderiaceae bacterium]|nr:pseudouridine synthase [Burkholderiaceae bacterium]